MRARDLDHAIEAIYATVVEPSSWPAALHLIACCFDARGALLITQHPGGVLATVVSPALAEAQRDYEAGWWKEDFLSHRAIEKGFLLERESLSDLDLATQAEMASHPFYREFRRRHGLGHVVAGSIAPAPSTVTFLSIQLRPDQPGATEEQHERLHILLRHCEQALRMACRIEEQRALSATFADTLSRIGFAVIVVDAAGKVVSCNEVAHDLLGRGLSIVAERLTLVDRVARQALDSALLRAIDGTFDEGWSGDAPIVAREAEGERPLVLYVLPVKRLRALGAGKLAHSAAAIVLVRDLASEPLDPSLVRDVLGLTLGEARIAAQIGSGAGPAEVADKLNISEQTVRTVLKRIFSKTGVSRQSELAALLGRLERIDLSPRA